MADRSKPLFEHWDTQPLVDVEPVLPGAFQLIRRSRNRSFANLWKTGKRNPDEESVRGEIPALDRMQDFGATFIQYQTESDDEVRGMKMQKTPGSVERPMHADTEFCSPALLRDALVSSGQLEELERLSNTEFGSEYRARVRFWFAKVLEKNEPCRADFVDYTIGTIHYSRRKYQEKYDRLLQHIDTVMPRYTITWKPGQFVAVDNFGSLHRRKDTSPGAGDGTRWHMEWEGLNGIQILYKPHDPLKNLGWKFVNPFIAEPESKDLL